MHLNSVPFNLIGQGKKTIEARINDEKRQGLSVDDEIILEERGHPEHTMRVRVVALHRYPTFAELFAAHDPVLFGDESKAELLEKVRVFYSEDEEKQYGVVGIEIAILPV